MISLVEFLFVGLILPFANSNYEYDYDPNSNYDSNAMIEDCDGPESDQLSETNCFCYDEPETDIPYSICKESVLPSGMVICNTELLRSYFAIMLGLQRAKSKEKQSLILEPFFLQYTALHL